MKRRHFEALRPLCPVCLGRSQQHVLRVASVVQEEGESIVEGALHCSNADCQHEFPIIDGIPFIIKALREYLAQNAFHLLIRDDLAETTESMVGDCCGPDCWYETVRQQLSSYSWGHYGDLDPRETKHPPLPGSVMRVLEAARGVGLRTLSGPAIDVGCSVGRTAFELAAESDDLVLGVDVHVAMLRLAHRVLRRGIVTYPRKRVGLVYDRREFSARFEHHENVDFWACDATELPFSDGTFAAAVNLNVLDSVRSPVDLITNVARLMRPGGRVLFSSPYDWSCVVTPLESWLGGHSQRGPHHGSAEPILRALLTPGAHPQSVKQLRIVAERDDVPWTVRIHERSTVSYKLHVIVAEAVESPRVADAASVREPDQD